MRIGKCRLWSRTPSPLPPRPIQPPASIAAMTRTPSTTDSQIYTGSSISADALEKLELEQRQTLQRHVGSSPTDIAHAVDDVREATISIQSHERSKNLHWSYRGREVYLKIRLTKFCNSSTD